VSVTCAAWLAACAEAIPKNSYGVASLEIRGAEHMDEAAIAACLATHPRERFGIVFGSAADPRCGQPPFNASRYPIELWAWPWTEWPLFNETAFERDSDRIERWYAARGYYDALVVDTHVLRNEEDREVEVLFSVREGEPVLVVRIHLHGLDELPVDVREQVRDAIELELGEPFDEAFYDRSKRAALEVLQEASYARAEVEGAVSLDPKQKLARVELRFTPGPTCRFGDVTLEGERSLPARPIKAAAAIEPGTPFSLAAMRDARLAIFALGPFASVDVDHTMRPESPVADVQIRVMPARSFRYGVGIGLAAGEINPPLTDLSTSINQSQWDVHLLGKIEHRNFLGGMRNLKIEERPRLIFDSSFPRTKDPAIGNLITLELRQPAFAEARTTLVLRARWDRGPDPYGGDFRRDDIVAGIGPERRFFEGKLLVSTSVNTDLFLPIDDDPDEDPPYPNTELVYMHHVGQLDLRDDSRNTTRGAFFAVGVQHGGYFLPGDWNYVRLTEDSRGYLPLPGGLVLAARLKLGFMAVTSSTIGVPRESASESDDESERRRYLANLAAYGPLEHRLRGGGSNSVRGYAPNTLGDVEELAGRLITGGLRLWESSVELRVPITQSFGTVLFVDAGDVSRSTGYRFDHPQTSLGIGLRYRTIVGPLRLDFALAPDELQVFGVDERVRSGVEQSTFFGLDGAVSFTIGEAF
jgi:outer membrane protein assembly factor BamA